MYITFLFFFFCVSGNVFLAHCDRLWIVGFMFLWHRLRMSLVCTHIQKDFYVVMLY